MKFAFTADLHLTKYSQDRIDPETNLPERLSSTKNVLDNIAKYCIDNSIDNVVIGGDIFDSKSVIYTTALNCIKNFFASHPLNFYVIDGNHDLSDKGQEAVSSLISIEHLPNVKRINVNGEVIFGNVLCIPNSVRTIELVKKNSNKFLISHFGLSEALLQSGISVISDVSLKHLRGKYKTVLLGHYHKPQDIITEEINVFYVGSPVQFHWGEKNEEKRFLVIDTEEETIESIPTVGYKKFLELIVAEDENHNDIINLAIEENKLGNHVRLSNPHKVKISEEVRSIIPVIDKVEESVANRGITLSMDEKEKFERFLQIKSVEEDLLKFCVSEALDIIQSCSQLQETK